MSGPVPNVSKLLASKLTRFTVRPCCPTPDGSVLETDVVVVMPAADIDEGFAEARRLLADGKSVRLLAPAVTLRHTWPAWVFDAPGLTLTELGALHTMRSSEVSAPQQRALKTWLSEMFRGSLEADVGRALFSSACSRIFQPTLLACPVGRGLASAFPSARFHIIGSRAQEAALKSFVAPSGAKVVEGRGRAAGTAITPWAARLAAHAVLALAGTIVRAVRDFRLAAPTRRMLRKRREQELRSRPSPRTWVALVPDWYRINKNLLDAFAVDAATREPLGILLVGTLSAGKRDEATMRSRASSELWPGLGELHACLDRCPVDQAVGAENVGVFASELLASGIKSVTALWRLSRRADVDLSGVPVDLTDHAWALATLATLDLSRAVTAHRASVRAARRRYLAGSTVLFCSTAAPNVASASVTLSRAGAQSVEHSHGYHGDWTGDTNPQADIVCVWSRSDARTLLPLGENVLVTGLPARTVKPHVRREGSPPRLLVMSNYTHRDSRLGGRFLWGGMQDEVLAVVPLVRAGSPQLRVRWRPHPADDALEIKRSLARLDDVELSRASSLDDDLDWADLVITTTSAVMFECIMRDIPMFVHAAPELWNLPATEFVDPERIFFYASDGAQKVAAVLDEFLSRSPLLLDPERRARRILFGRRGEPEPMSRFFGATATRRPNDALFDAAADETA